MRSVILACAFGLILLRPSVTWAQEQPPASEQETDGEPAQDGEQETAGNPARDGEIATESEEAELDQAAAMAQPAANGSVELPPAITDSRTYRCSDNSLFYVEFYNNGTAMIRTSRDGAPTQLTQTGGGAYEGGGQSVSANAIHGTINGKACHT